MENITMDARGFTRTLPEIITSALWSGWSGDGEDYSRRVDELRSMNRMFATLGVPVRIDFWYDYSIGNSTPHAVRVGTDEDGNGGMEIEAYYAAQERWYAKHPEERPAPPRECTEAELDAFAEELRRLLWGDAEEET